MVRMVLFGGKLALHDWEDLIPARALVRRLWCRTSMDNRIRILHMPHQLCASAMLLLAGDGHKKIRDSVEQVRESIDD